MVAKAPAVQFYYADLLSNAYFNALSNELRGVYWTLLAFEWTEGGQLEDNPEFLAAIARETPERFAVMWKQLARFFVPHPTKPGYLVNPRAQKEREKQEEFRQAQADRGKLGNEKRWGNRDRPSHRDDPGIAGTSPSTAIPGDRSSSSSPSSREEREPSVQYTAPAPEPPPPAPLSPESRLEPEPGTPDPEIQRARDAVRTEIRARTGGVDPPVKKRDADAFDGLVRRHGADAVIGRAVTFWRYRRPPGLADRGSVPGIGWFVRHFAEIEPAGASEPPPAPGAPRRAEPYVEPPPRATPEQQARTNREGLAQLAAALGRTVPAQPSGPSEPSGPTPPPHTERPSRRRARRGDERLSDPDRALGERQRDSVNALRKSVESPAASPTRSGVEREASVAEPARPP